MKSLSVILSFASILAYGEYSNAACNAMVNNRPMSAEFCRHATAIYGYVEPGHYLLDRAGNWIKLDPPYSSGNIYRDAEGSSESGSWSYRSNTTGGTRDDTIGKDSDGCYYAFGWSNC